MFAAHSPRILAATNMAVVKQRVLQKNLLIVVVVTIQKNQFALRYRRFGKQSGRDKLSMMFVVDK